VLAGNGEACVARVPKGEAKLFEKAAVAVAKKSPEKLAPSLQLLEGVPQAPKYRAMFEIAEVGLAAGNEKEAVPLLQDVVNDNPAATASTRVLAQQLARSQPTKADVFCTNLLTTGRSTQALACLEGGGPALSEKTRLAIISAQPSLTPTDLQFFSNGKPGSITDEVRAGLERCQTKQPLRVRWTPARADDVNLSPGVARAYELLAENVQDDATRTCLLALAAASCIRDIQERKTCTSTSALASYARTVFTASESSADNQLLRPEEFVGALFAEKAAAYAHADAPDAKLTLIEIHLALAHVYRDRKNDPFNHNWKWHLDRAKEHWTALHGKGRPFPDAISAQLERSPGRVK